MAWTQDRIRTLIRLWRDNWTVPAIASALGMTRGAVHSKLHRLRMAGDVGVLTGDFLRWLSDRVGAPPAPGPSDVVGRRRRGGRGGQ